MLSERGKTPVFPIALLALQLKEPHLIKEEKGRLKVTEAAVLSGGSCIGEGNGNPLQCSCLEKPRDGGAWWAAVYGVGQRWTRLSDFTFTFHFHTLEKEMTTNSNVLA